MATTGVGSVLNTANWSLLKDGMQITGGISEITFGMNMASQMTDRQRQSALPRLDRHQQVRSGASSSTPTAPRRALPLLTDGHYQLVALNSMQDVAGNPLGRTGLSSPTATTSAALSTSRP